MTKTYKDFQDFYEHPFIKSIKDNKKWTISTNKKMPIDIFMHESFNCITGALFTNSHALTSLNHLCELFPRAKNHAYYMDALVDNFVLLDIEPKCPDDIKQKLLETNYVYGEISMSGKGVHLVFPVPDCIDDYPIVKNKIVMKEEHGYYEILLQHYVTFTRNQIPKSKIKNQDNFIKIFKELAEKQKEHNVTDVDIKDMEPDIPKKDEIINILSLQKFGKTPKDYHDDMSFYEWAAIEFLMKKLDMLLKTTIAKQDHVYSDNERAWLVYKTLPNIIEERDKHYQRRHGLPWLLYLCETFIAKEEKNNTRR